MVDLVHARLDSPSHLHAPRDMAGHAQPPAMGLPGDVGDELGFERAVELDLGEARVGITSDQRHGLLGRRGDVDADGGRPLSVDDPGHEQAGSEASPGGDGVPGGGDELELFGAVPCRGHPGGEVDRPPFDLGEVGVHLPEPRKDGQPSGFKDLRRAGSRPAPADRPRRFGRPRRSRPRPQSARLPCRRSGSRRRSPAEQSAAG